MSPSKPSASPSPLRLLILSPISTDTKSIPPFRPFLEAITGSKPSNDITAFAGYTSHPPLRLKTKYYDRNVGIWCDELPSPSPPSASPQGQSGGKVAPTGKADAEDVSEVKDDSMNPGESTDPNSSPATLADWKVQILSDEAAEVRAVIGGIILLLPISTLSSNSTIPPSSLPQIETLHALREAIEDESYGRDVASLVVLQGTNPSIIPAKLKAMLEKLEDLCLSEGILGWDFVAWNGQVPSLDESTVTAQESGNRMESRTQEEERDERNEFGEKTGLKRVLEVLEGIDWSASPNHEDGEDGEEPFALNAFDDDNDETPNFLSKSKGMNTSSLKDLDFELQREMMELKISMLDDDHPDDNDDNNPSQSESKSQHQEDDEEAQIEQFPGLIERVVAIREAGSEMAPSDREKFAKREIARIMREMG